ncbi:sigma-70 family RNA polymerase sigma factor [Fictibacillus sp. BK138]|uniref:sigma-70 family RNA polymerase sigma factor n=1 Tax=Fictibacillus sp. BK138 TaxID=2512121 RepID=UPI0010EA3EC4|nr:sigma-70 family RNA polymerase sigma factor [Fictibacillus sp. BK138]RZT23539.1 RNA polymerase sigma-70 factor (ECF subfamily) [Fictibacillus sp. BK138]
MPQSKTTTLYEQSRELQQQFQTMIDEMGSDLWKYCRYLTGSPWDGEDLFQETVLKAMGGLFTRWHPTNLKSYLYRMATNTWIDHCRREKRNVGSLDEAEEPQETFTDTHDLEEALEKLYHLFTPRQTAVFLLMEVFSFKAEEVASIIKTTPGAVYATTRRMKEKLKNEAPSPSKPTDETKEQKDEIISAYLKAFNQGDLEGILALFGENVHYEASLGFLETTKDEMREGSLMYGLPNHHAEEFMLWGKPVIVVLADSNQGPLVHDIQYQDVENGKIVYHRSFFFRKEFILAASKELGIPPQLDKAPLNWT